DDEDDMRPGRPLRAGSEDVRRLLHFRRRAYGKRGRFATMARSRDGPNLAAEIVVNRPTGVRYDAGMRILALGDIVGRPGRQAVHDLLPQVVNEHRIDLVIANGENIAGGSG